MRRQLNLVIMLLGVGLPGALLAQDARSPTDIPPLIEEYVRLTFQERELDGASKLLAEDVHFVDPTGAVFGGPLGKGITGREAVLALQKSWEIEEGAFNREVSFACGEYACFAGTLDYRMKNQPAVEGLPFVTILRLRDGLIGERLDLGDYARVAPGAIVPERHLKKNAEAYLKAYLEMRFDDLSEMLAEDAVFNDPTAVMMGGGAIHSGRDTIVNAFRSAFGVVLNFEFEPVRSFFFQHHAIFAGPCSYTLKGAAINMERESVAFTGIPLMVVLKIVDGKVVEHYDYSDYDVFNMQMEEMMAPGDK